MSLLSERVEKAKKAEYKVIPGVKGAFATWGSSGTYENSYQIRLTATTEKINDNLSPEGKISINVITAKCQQNSGSGKACDCPGNERHTVCYHCLGAIYNAYKTKSSKYVSYYEDYQDALCGLRLYKNGKLLKVKSDQGEGVIWAVTRPIPAKKESKNLDNLAVNLMRGNESDEGID